MLPADLCHQMYSLSRSIDLRRVKQIDAIFIGQSHQLLRHLLRESGWKKEGTGWGERQPRTLQSSNNTKQGFGNLFLMETSVVDDFF